MNSQCDRCKDGKGYYSIDRDHPDHLLVCGFFEQFVEELEKREEEEEREISKKLEKYKKQCYQNWYERGKDET